MKKYILIFLAAFLCFLLVFPSFAAQSVPDVYTPLTEPIISYTRSSSGTDITIYACTYDTRSNQIAYLLWLITAHSDDTSAVFGHDYTRDPDSYLICDKPFRYDLRKFNLSDGTLVQNFTGQALSFSSYNDILQVTGFYRCGFVFNQGSANTQGHTWAYYMLPDNFPQDTPNDVILASNHFVSWSILPPVQTVYRSFCSRPVYDPYNRYMILAGSEASYLYAIRYFMSDTMSFTYSAGGGDYEGTYNNFIVPYLDVTNNGFQFRLSVPEDLIDLINSQGYIAEYDLQITAYNLSDGSYVGSYVYTDFSVIDSVVDFSLIYPDIDTIDSVDFYGVMYQNTSTRYKFNLLSCVWGVDPSFEDWKAQITDYLDLIYQALSSDQEEVTIEADTSQANELHELIDNLQPTNEQGQTINTADEVADRFEEAESYLADMNDGIQPFNEIITDTIFWHPLFYIPLFISLALGLLITILGKNKSD